MMRKLKSIFLLLPIILLVVSCRTKSDDGPIAVTVSLEEQEPVDDQLLIDFLSSHYYNEEEFTNAANITNFSYDIEFSEDATVTGYDSNGDGVIDASDIDNTTVFNRTKLIDLVTTKVVTVGEVDHNLYILNERLGGGTEQPRFSDSVFVAYRGMNLDKESFDATPNPAWLNLPGTVRGFANSVSEFRTAASRDDLDGDGQFTFYNYGIGAAFMPSGLGYFNAPPTGISSYAPLIFTFKVMEAKLDTDHDQDGINSFDEDLDGNGYLSNDDTDADGVPNYLDSDDDGDGVLTKDEDTNNDGDLNNDDFDNDGIPDYLDSDS